MPVRAFCGKFCAFKRKYLIKECSSSDYRMNGIFDNSIKNRIFLYEFLTPYIFHNQNPLPDKTIALALLLHYLN